MHIKRITMPKPWPIARKEKNFIVAQRPGKIKERSVALVVFLRDLLKEVSTFREAKKAIKAGHVEVNGKIVKDEKFPVALFDRIFIKELKKHFTLHLDERGKLKVKGIDTKRYGLRPTKVIGKRILKKKKMQLNFEEGYNLILKENKIKVGDSLLLDIKNKKIGKVLPLEKGATAFLIKGKNAGKYGKVTNVKDKKVKIKLDDEEKEMSSENLYVVEENEFK
ncbi:MAG: hypothetical protein JSW08_03845 [archaeon]|nr:MAG: hypothetical protein JSW08_03845 [archaeon]